ncbi:MAG: hypothetical protein QNL57_03390 [Alphaproteobacteria bacterium]
MSKVQKPSALFFSDELPSRKSLLSSASCITGGNQLLWTMSALILSACGGGGGGGSSPSSSDTAIPAGKRNSLRPVSSATDFTIQVGQAPRRHITSLNDQTTEAQTAQDHSTGSQTTDSQDSSEQRQVEGQNVNNNGDTPSAPTEPNTDTPQVPADTTPPAMPCLSLVDPGTDDSDSTTCNNQVAVSGLEDGASVEYSIDGGTTWTPGTSGAGASGTNSSFTVDDGTYAAGDIQVHQTDAAGNISQPVQLGPVSVDTTAPSRILTAPDFDSDGVLNVTEASQPLIISGTTSGVEDDQTVTITLADKTYTATVTNNSWSSVIPVIDLQALAEGDQMITANVSGAAGNPAAEAIHQFSIYPIAPRLTITDDTGDNILTLNIHDVIDITNDNNIVRVSGESGDKVVSAGCRDTGTDKVVDGITYNVFKDSSDATLAELWVDQDIDIGGITAGIL